MKTIYMPKKHLDTWLSALRSGKYEQGEGHLERYDKYCCLGVLQKAISGCVSERNDVPELSWLKDNNITFLDYSRMPDQVPIIYLEDGDTNPMLLTELNDKGESFLKLADLIEEHAEAVEEAS